MKELSGIPFHPGSGSIVGSAFLRGILEIEGEPKDSFLRLDGFHHGVAAVNGFLLGRYYNDAGPQKTLYCPAPMLRRGRNEIVVFEMDGADSGAVFFTDVPELG